MKTLKIKKTGETLIITKSGLQTNGTITEFDGIEAAGCGPPMHVHYQQEEMVKVVSGKMRVKTDVKEFSLKEGEHYLFKAGEPHKFWNEGESPLHYTGHVTPSGNYEYFIEKIYESANEAKDDKPGFFDAAFLLTKYKTEMGILEIPKWVQTIVFPILLPIGKVLGKFEKYQDAPDPI